MGSLKKFFFKKPPAHSGGFTLIEIILVIAIVMFIYSVALPQFSMRSGAEVAGKLSQFASDVRNAYDLAVLSGKPHRLVIQFNSGDYWLEVADRQRFTMGAIAKDRDLTAEEEEDIQQAFDNDFAEYETVAGQAIIDPETDQEIKPESPVVNAKDRLRPPKWTKVDSMEWTSRSFGPNLLINSMQAEHHGRRQELSNLGEEGRGVIHFFPAGYVERAVLYVYYKKDELVPDEDQEPYTIKINPYEGTADFFSGIKEIDVHDDSKA
jgi:type II secretory pathway pseudopilin PulG